MAAPKISQVFGSSGNRHPTIWPKWKDPYNEDSRFMGFDTWRIPCNTNIYYATHALGVKYGSTLHDWDIWDARSADYEYAEGFWDMIESPWERILGAWIDWDDYWKCDRFSRESKILLVVIAPATSTCQKLPQPWQASLGLRSAFSKTLLGHIRNSILQTTRCMVWSHHALWGAKVRLAGRKLGKHQHIHL